MGSYKLLYFTTGKEQINNKINEMKPKQNFTHKTAGISAIQYILMSLGGTRLPSSSEPDANV